MTDPDIHPSDKRFLARKGLPTIQPVDGRMISAMGYAVFSPSGRPLAAVRDEETAKAFACYVGEFYAEAAVSIGLDNQTSVVDWNYERQQQTYRDRDHNNRAHKVPRRRRGAPIDGKVDYV